MIVKSIGANGQITLGKEFAGRLVMIDQTEPGVWQLKLGAFIPDNEQWLHAPEAKEALDKALAWAQTHPPADTDLDALEKKLLKKGRGKTRAVARPRKRAAV